MRRPARRRRPVGRTGPITWIDGSLGAQAGGYELIVSGAKR